MTNLRLIESSDCATLPATVYLRGFLLEYARSLHLDPKPVMEGYLEIVRAERESRDGGVDADG
jgi:cytoskeletal protein RodZ